MSKVLVMLRIHRVFKSMGCMGVLAALSLAACGEGGDRPMSTSPSDPQDAAMLDWARSVSSQSQKEVLAKGYVTFEEYEQAMLNAVACFHEGGIATEGPTLDRTGTYYEYVAKIPDDADYPRLEAWYNKCTAEHLDGILAAWNWQHRASEQEIQQAREALAACLRESGIEVPTAPTSADFSTAMQANLVAFGSCSDDVSAEYGIPHFAG